MSTRELDLHFLTFINDRNEDNYQSLMKACLTYAKTSLSLYPSLELYHDDIARDIALSAMKAAPNLHTDGPFSAWLFTVTANKIIDYQRKIEWRQQDEYDEDTLKPAKFTAPREVSELIDLDEVNRHLLIDIEDGYTIEQTCERNNLSRKAFDRRMDRLKAKRKQQVNG